MNYDNIMASLPEASSKFEPCFAFSVHKCGSTMMNNMIRAVCQAADVPAATLPTYFFNEGIPPNVWSRETEMLPVFSQNLLYYGFRFLPPSFKAPEFDIKSRRFVLLVRDPRDALVSQYFSYGKKDGSHKLPKKNADKMIAKMAASDDLTIDEYVVREAPKLVEKFAAYRDALNFDLGMVRTYEDVFFNKEKFVGDIFAHFGIDVPAEVVASTVEKFDVRPEVEDQTKHIRKGTPGDHAEKLEASTIDQLNDICRDVSAFYGYKL